MSNDINSLLYERAREMCDYWEGTPRADVIRQDIKNNDLESMFKHVIDAEAEASRKEFYAEGNDVE